MFRKVLIENRGVVTTRVARALKAEGIPWVAVHSEADAGMAYVREADAAYCIGPPPARDSYLNVDALLDAVRRSGCDAVHPGWGFLSENAALARAVDQSGVRFIGPRATRLGDFGSCNAGRKSKARILSSDQVDRGLALPMRIFYVELDADLRPS